jgi:alpha-D-xyloside xylohydrolase
MNQKNVMQKQLLKVVALIGMVVSMPVLFSSAWGLNITSYTQDAEGITCVCNTGVMKVHVCKDDIVRVAYSPTSTIPKRSLKIVTNSWTPATPFTKTESGDDIVLETAKLKIKVNKTTANVTFTDLSGAVILSEYSKTLTPVTVQGVSTYSVVGEWNSPADEGLFGLGQHQGNKVNYKGQTEYIDQRYAEGTAVAILVSTKGYGIFWDNYSNSNFDGTVANKTRYSFKSDCSDIAGGIFDYYFFYGPEIDQVIAGYRTATGHVPLFPKWGYGLIQSRDRYESQTEIYSIRDGYRNNKIPVDCIVQDWHFWDGAPNGKQGCFCFNSSYGDYKTTIKELHKANIHTMVSIWSQLERGSPPFENFQAKGWLWPTTNPNCGEYALFLDTYNAQAREAFWELIRDNMFDSSKIGFDSWWLDNDEPWPHPCGLDRNGVNTAMGKGALFYNTYTFPMSEMGYKNWRRDIPGKRFVMLHRANYPGQQAHSTMQWSNDILSNFDVLKAQVPCGLNTTICGIPYWCSDIGGYWGPGYAGVDFSLPLNQELMTRWVQYGAFCPVFRIHGKVKVGQGKELFQSNFSATTRANMLIADKLRYRLMPYVYSLAWMTTNQHYTPMRHLIFDFRTDPRAKEIGNQFMYGPAMMVSPITAQGQTSRDVYLPAGKWYNFWTGATANSGDITVDAPLSQIPLHVRAGSILPMGPDIQYAAERADTIELRVYPGKDGAFTIYEDEGDSYNYETGKYAEIPITYVDGEKNVIIGRRKGSFPGMDAKKIFNIVFVSNDHGTGIGKTSNPDHTLEYTGEPVAVIPLSIHPERISNAMNLLPAVTFRTIGSHISFPGTFSGKVKSIVVYDYSGKLLKKAEIRENSIDLRKDLGLSTGAYIVKSSVIR